MKILGGYFSNGLVSVKPRELRVKCFWLCDSIFCRVDASDKFCFLF